MLMFYVLSWLLLLEATPRGQAHNLEWLKGVAYGMMAMIGIVALFFALIFLDFLRELWWDFCRSWRGGTSYLDDERGLGM